jgi:hypothetical protein
VTLLSAPDDVHEGDATDVVSQYLEWNDRIFERFFPLSANQALRILSFDASELRSVAGEMGRAPDEFSTAIRALIDPVGRDPFALWWLLFRGTMSDRDPPCYVGLLALFSLAASESGDAIAGGQRAFFHRQLAHLLGLNEMEYVRGFANATALYNALETYLRVRCAGRRGTLLVATTSFGGKYVWRARVQVLLNASSRRQLAFYFDHRCANRGELRTQELGALLMDELGRPQDYVLSNSLRRTLELVCADGAQVFDGFVDLVETEYVRWFLSRNEEFKRPNDAHQRNTAATVKSPIVDAVQIHSTSRTKSESRVVYEKRLALRSQIAMQPWRVWVQARKTGDDWDAASSARLSWGSGTIAYELDDGTQGSLPVDDPTTFANDGGGWVAAQQVRAGDHCAVLGSRHDAEALTQAFSKLPGTEPTIRVCAEAPDAAIVTARVPRATGDEIPESLRHLIAGDQARLTFRRGLRIATQYFETAPPRVVYDHPTIQSTSVSLDGLLLPEPILRRVEYRLPGFLSSGLHVVEILGIPKSFSLSDQLVMSEMDPYDCEGFEVCHARGVALPVKAPGGTPSDEYHNAKVIIVVGALLL